jgi:two-component system phosphate regulon sensor histidine kinase PhoR
MSWLTLLLIALLVLLTALALWALIGRRRARRETDAVHRQAADCTHDRIQLDQTLGALRQVMPSAVVLLDEQGRVVWTNEAAAGFLADGDGFPVFSSQALSEVVAMTGRDKREHTRQFIEDSSVYLARSFVLDNRAQLLALTVEDVTELQRLGRARRDFVANISHDLRTPIATIQLLVETLQEGAFDKPKKREKLLDGIASQTLTLQQLAQELMDLSLIESGRMPLRLVETPLAQVIEPALNRLMSQIERQHIELVRAYNPDLTVLADAESLQRVLQNLLHNAIKFTPEDGAITITSQIEDDEVRISVSDTGPGIPPEHLDRIFERFYKTDSSRSSGGSGLGLAIAKHIVEGHGGRIWAESTPGAGAVFCFTLIRA